MTDLQVDLADFQQLAHANNGFRYLLLGVDVMTRMFFGVPTKSKKAQDIIEAFKLLFSQMPALPSVIYSDKGTEFENQHLKKFLEEKHIAKWHSVDDQTKAAVAERGIQTLKKSAISLLPEIILTCFQPALQVFHGGKHA